MKPETEQLLATLEVLVKPLSFRSEGGEPFQAFVIEGVDRDNFTITSFLKELNFFRPVEIETFLQEWQRKLSDHPLAVEMTQKYHDLIHLLQVHLVALSVYELITNNEGNCLNKIYSDDEPFLILVGKTHDDNWIGLSPLWPTPHTCGYGQRLNRNIQSSSQAALELEAQLKPILQGLKLIIGNSGGYHPSKEIVWQVAQTRALLIEQLLESSRYLKTWEFQGFSDEFSQKYFPNEYFDDEITETEIQTDDQELEWYEFYEIEEPEEEYIWQVEGVEYKYKFLEKFLMTNLRNRRIYVMGNSGNFRIYVVGRTREGDWLGILTQAVWT